ncbi:LOW QUALITY PROTEIN: islet cell autoantigen 1 [Anthonomus grandis grandis]|uniref:LOW QUALITY PROTEIN: islet cell autoantigen 1 n=1 Tax=Anthonomus grandis grandis TaxID=2921223 RepID=UPI0021656D9D|nr:LOW QUALITY PROTEIN: islet cell autoantigen 1 [Anthonomus grandis grandis]
MLSNNMQHQYWVTKKSVLRKLGGKEDECIVSSDAELDAKLELFKSVNESCMQLQRVIDLYQERLCYLAQEENALGRYLKECGKNEKNVNAGQLMSTAGKALAYTGHQRLTVRPPLVRLHHEVETFRARAISDTRTTVSEMEKSRTEYRAALSWMKSASNALDPDTGYGLEKFRKAQAYVKTSKTKFDRYTLACLQKVDLLAAARCNMFSHALVPYQNALALFATKALETLTLAAGKLSKVEPYDFSVVTELSETSPQKPRENVDADNKDRNTFFNAEYSDETKQESLEEEEEEAPSSSVSNLLGEDFALPPLPSQASPDLSKPSAALLDLAPSLSDLLGDENSAFMPSSLMQEGATFDFQKKPEEEPEQKRLPNNKTGEGHHAMSWLSLFAELDPLANGVMEDNVNGDRA